jgi:hypothetical protein
MTFTKGPLVMGLMLPWMLHAEQSVGLAIVLTHVAVIGGTALVAAYGATRFEPAARLLSGHRPKLTHLGPMGVGLGLGWSMVCVFCIAIWQGAI